MIESTFTRSILKGLPPEIYKWKVQNVDQNGVPDCYLSGTHNDLWMEVKYIKAPKRDTTIIDPTKLLSPLQLRWLNGRHAEGRNVCVLLGSDIGHCIFQNGKWNNLVYKTSLTLTRQDVIRWITRQTLG